LLKDRRGPLSALDQRISEIVVISTSYRVAFRSLDCGGNFIHVSFQRKMTGVEELNHRIQIVASERFCSGRQKEWIILPPRSQQGQLPLSEERLKLS